MFVRVRGGKEERDGREEEMGERSGREEEVGTVERKFVSYRPHFSLCSQEFQILSLCLAFLRMLGLDGIGVI